MRLASFNHNGRRQVGVVSADGATVTALDLKSADPARGMLAVIHQLSGGHAMPATTGPAIPLAQEGQNIATAVDQMVGGPPTARQLVEEAFYRGRTASDLARTHGLAEPDVRRMLQDGIRELRQQLR